MSFDIKVNILLIYETLINLMQLSTISGYVQNETLY